MSDPQEAIQPPADAVLVPWHTEASVRDAWPDAAGIADLGTLLAVTREAVWFYVPPMQRARDVIAGADVNVVPALVPPRYRLGQLMHLQSLATVRATSPSADVIGMEGFQARVYVFGAEVRKVLMPPTFGEVWF